MEPMVGLREIRRKKGYSQLKVAMAMSISREALSLYENGKRCPDTRMLRSLSEYFDVSIDYLITGREFVPRLAQEAGSRAVRDWQLTKSRA